MDMSLTFERMALRFCIALVNGDTAAQHLLYSHYSTNCTPNLVRMNQRWG